MKSFNLLFVLLDTENKRVLVAEKGNLLPSHTEPVGENVGFDEPQMYNNSFEKATGITVYRRYSFNTEKSVVFVFEHKDTKQTLAENGYKWVLCDDFIDGCCDAEIAEIVRNVKSHYNISDNMPWVSADGFSPYMNWLISVCDKHNIRITGKIAQLKNVYVSTVFRVPTDNGNIYMKIPGKIFITEIPFTRGLQGLGIVNLPSWIAYDEKLNVYLMLDMGGNDLPHQSDVSTLHSVIVEYANIQKASTSHMPLKFKHYDNTIATMLHKLRTFAEKSCVILQKTHHALSVDETKKLEKQVKAAIAMLESIASIPIPNTIHHGDVRPGNIRVIDGRYMFYDWAWGAISHPFVEIISFMHIIRRTLPDETAKETLIDIYIWEWLEYGSYDNLKRTFSVLATLKDLFFAVVDYDWVEAIIQSSTEPTKPPVC